MGKKQKAMPYNFIKRQNFYLWMFISQEGLWDDAREFLAENMQTPIPFELAGHRRMSNKPIDLAYPK